jgi:hypothetical protein
MQRLPRPGSMLARSTGTTRAMGRMGRRTVRARHRGSSQKAQGKAPKATPARSRIGGRMKQPPPTTAPTPSRNHPGPATHLSPLQNLHPQPAWTTDRITTIEQRAEQQLSRPPLGRMIYRHPQGHHGAVCAPHGIRLGAHPHQPITPPPGAGTAATEGKSHPLPTEAEWTTRPQLRSQARSPTATAPPQTGLVR